jgi:hypothetical protein
MTIQEAWAFQRGKARAKAAGCTELITPRKTPRLAGRGVKMITR